MSSPLREGARRRHGDRAGQYLYRAIEFCERATILRRGTVAWSGATNAMGSELVTHYIGEQEEFSAG